MRSTVFPFQQNQLLLRSSSLKCIPPLIAMLGLAVVGAWLLQHGRPIGWVMAVVGGLGSLLTGIQLLPNSTYLWLTAEGLAVRSLFRRRRLPWSKVEWFSPTKRGVEVRYVTNRGARIVEILPHVSEMEPRELADLLNKWRVRAARAESTTA